MMKKTESAGSDPRYAVVILGMHRSGTSALAGVFARLGCDMPNDLMPDVPQHPKEFYESAAISSLNDSILDSAGTAWYLWQEFNTDWFTSPKAIEFKHYASKNLNANFPESRLFVVKDPRMCLLVPFWEKVFDNEKITPLYVHTLRNPLEVAESLKVWIDADNERLPGYTINFGLMLWLRYMLEAEQATRGKKRCFTSYSQVIEDWESVSKKVSDTFSISWPRKSENAVNDIESFLQIDLRHHNFEEDRRKNVKRLSPWVEKTYKILKSWAQNGEEPRDYQKLDMIFQQFRSSAPAFSFLIESGRAAWSSLLQEKSARISDLSEIETLKAAVNGYEQQAKLLVEKNEERQHEADILTQEKLALEARLSAATISAEAAQAEAKRIAFELGDSLHNNEVLERKKIALEDLHRALQEELDDLQRALAEMTGQKNEAESALRQRSAERDDLNHQVAAANRQNSDLNAELAQVRDAHQAAILEQHNMLRTLRLERVRLEKQMQQQVESAIKDARAKTDLAQTMLAQRDADLVQRQEHCQALELDLAIMRDKCKSLEHDRATVQERILQVEVQKTNIENALSQSNEQAKSLSERLKNASTRIVDLEHILELKGQEHLKAIETQKSALRSMQLERVRLEQQLKQDLELAVSHGREKTDAALAEVDQLSARLKESQDSNAMAARQLEMLNGQLEALERNHSAELSKRGDELHAAYTRLLEMENGNREILESSSWRMTAPLRRLAKFIKR